MKNTALYKLGKRASKHRLLWKPRAAYLKLRDGEMNLKKTTYNDRPFYYPKNSLIGQDIASGKQWDSILGLILRTHLPDSPVIVEVGSNIGASLMQMQLVRPRAHYYCFEPSNRFLPALRKNVRTNRWANVVVEGQALGSSAQEVVLSNNASTASLVTEEYDSHTYVFSQKTTTSTLDTYFANKPVDFIKVDTDGFDYDVLLGGKGLLLLQPLVYFELEPKLLKEAGRKPEQLLEYLKSLGYKEFIVFSNLGRPLTLTKSIAEVVKLTANYPYTDVLAGVKLNPALLTHQDL